MRHPGSFDPARGYPSVVPYVRYPDPAAAIEWLSRVLGAREVLRMTLPDGRIGHAERTFGAGLITLGLHALRCAHADSRLGLGNGDKAKAPRYGLAAGKSQIRSSTMAASTTVMLNGRRNPPDAC